MKLQWTYVVCVVCVLGGMTLLGCGSDSGTVPVTGTVTLDGEPVEGATVTFTPAGGQGDAAVGKTDASGEFSVQCTAGEGAMPGKYLIGVSKLEVPPEIANAGPGDMDAIYEAAEAAGEDVTGGKTKVAQVKDLLPTKYKNPATSGFEHEVKAGQGNKLTLEMTSE